MKVALYSMVAFVILTMGYACNKSSLVGSDLFVPDSIELNFEDDFEIKAKTVRVDSVKTNDESGTFSSLIVGELNDPAFGPTKADGYVDVSLGGSTAATPPDFRYEVNEETLKVSLDSVVLVLAYNQNGFYGDTNAIHNLEVRVMNEAIPEDVEIYSNTFYESDQLIGTKRFVPRPDDSLFIFNAGDTVPTAVANQLRVRLNDEWAQEMIDDTMLVSNAENLLAYIPGLHLTSRVDGSGTMGFNFGSTSDGSIAENNIVVYYSEGDVKKSYSFIVNGQKHNYYQHDLEGGDVGAFIDDEEKGDSLLFIQGMAGPLIDLEIPLLISDDLDGFVINKVELEFFVLEESESNIYDPIAQVILQEMNEEGEYALIQDANASFDLGIDDLFGGEVMEVNVDGTMIKRYRTSLSVHTISQFKSDMPTAKLRIAPRNKPVRPNRSIIFGPNHSDYPMKLKVNYSN